MSEGKCPPGNCPRIYTLLFQNINAEKTRGMENPRVATNTLSGRSHVTTPSLIIVLPVDLQVAIGIFSICWILIFVRKRA